MSVATILNLNSVRNASADGTVKLRFCTAEWASYEACLLHLNYRAIPNVICVSTQLGCPFDCSFCAIGAQQFQRNLTTSEISQQIMAALADPFWERKLNEFEIAAMGT